MNELEVVLDDCLQQMASGAGAGEVLARYPQHAAELRPLLGAAARLQRGRELTAPQTFKERTRRELIAHVKEHHPRPKPVPSVAWRLTAGIAAMVALFMLSGTAFAQEALPGQAFYGWKLASENAWRAVASDRVAVDIGLADRRAFELTAVSQQPGRQAAIDSYHEALGRLQSESSPSDSDRIRLALESHREQLLAAGIDDPQLNEILHVRGRP